MLKVGLDVGSTTAKIVVAGENGELLYSRYERHHADVVPVVAGFFDEIAAKFPGSRAALTVTGSVGMGIAESFRLPFAQEVVAAAHYVRTMHPDVSTIIDIGGEDAKIVYLTPDGNADLRMNGNCAGGTGAFIDQMAALLGVEVGELDALAAKAERRHPIASRCGVFSKTDVQNLISKNVCKPDIAASVFHAVAVQTVVTLSRGCEMKPKILLCGGPLTFIPSLRKALVDYLEMPETDFVIPDNANIIPAWGAALSSHGQEPTDLSELSRMLRAGGGHSEFKTVRLDPIFSSEEEYEAWKLRKNDTVIERVSLEKHSGDAFLGIDSGSTTTKIVVTDPHDRIIFAYYSHNEGDPVNSVRKGLEELDRLCRESGVSLRINGSCSTGYGEDLIKAAFGLDRGIIETIAHFVAARKIDPQVSFILDIGGQDMKAIFVENGVLSRMEINEACSSGCGSFIETFASSLRMPVADFAREACLAASPCDLGTRCTVFMNSKVKQVLREGATLGDIAAGLSYSVVKNCLYKVLKLKDASELGQNIVVQGGTMRNDSVVRALEKLTDTDVSRSNMPELMGAYGCALYARSAMADSPPIDIKDIIATARYSARQIECGGCENNCWVQKYRFDNGNVYYSGNKCEKVFTNRGEKVVRGRNLSTEKNGLLFNRKGRTQNPQVTIGVPRALGTYENYPFWHTLLDECGFGVELSSPSTFTNYEAGVHTVMSDNICFPAKLAHSHIYDLISKGVDRIFMPYVVYEKSEGTKTSNSYNCPIVSGYSEVIKSAVNPAVPVDAPVITFRDCKLLEKGCVEYLAGLGIGKSTAKKAVAAAVDAQEEYETEIKRINMEAYDEAQASGSIVILLAGRPYHTDPLVQHKLSDMIADMGVTVVTEDIVRDNDAADLRRTHHVSQWAYINRILRAADFVGNGPDDLHYVQMTSFGCGPDAFLLDEVKSTLNRHGKSLTLLKIDDVNNIGSLKLRVRSVVESLRFGSGAPRKHKPFVTTKAFGKEDRKRTILIPYFTDYISPLISPIMKLAGYDTVQLPESDMESAEYGLVYANNEVCYPATLIVGDLVKALASGEYDLDNTAVIITQTGGQCRASNYIALIKKGLTEAGYTNVPVLSMAFGKGMVNEQTGFTINWLKIMPMALAAILFGDTLSKFYHASAPREKEAGVVRRLRDHYLEAAKECIATGSSQAVYDLIPLAARDFNAVLRDDVNPPRVGVVGEIYLKFNSFAHKRVVEWLVERGVEVMPPILTDFFTQSFVNRKVKRQTNLTGGGMPEILPDMAYSLIWRYISKVNRLASEFRHFVPFANIFDAADHGKEVITLNAQFGEGWLLPAEIVGFAKSGVNNVISLQPFGCIANHIVSRGVENRIKRLYPQMNILSLDFDSGVSDVNVTNRLLLMTDNLKYDEQRG